MQHLHPGFWSSAALGMAARLRRARRSAACLAGLLLLPCPVLAVDYHACDCAAGAAPQCVPGDDTASGSSPEAPWRSYEHARSAWQALQPGDAIRFCRGGVQPIAAGTQWVNGNCTAAAPCRIGAYQPPWSADAQPRPRIVQEHGHGFAFANAGAPAHEEGVVLSDLEISCSSCGDADWGVFLYNDIDDLVMQGLHVHGFAIGVHLAGANACDTPGCDRSNARIALLDSDITDNSASGWLGADQHLLIADSRFLRNGTGTVFDHNLYLSQSGGPTTGIRVLRNELYRSAAVASGSCQGGSLAVHGEHADLLIEGNFIHEDIGAAEPACWGLGVTPAYGTPEGFAGAVIRGNRIRNVGNVAIALASCSDCVVENNLVESAQPFGTVAVLAPALPRAADDAPLQRLVVRNNSIFTAAAGSTGIRVGGEGNGHVVASNALQSVSSGEWACLSLDLPSAAYALVDHNVCGFDAGAGREWEQGSGNLAAWTAATGWDAHSLQQLPGFAAPGAPQHDLRAASADAAMVGLGHPTHSAPLQYSGALRGIPPDAGAHQFAQALDLFADGFEQ